MDGKTGDMNFDEMMADINKQQGEMPDMEENMESMFGDAMDAEAHGDL